MELLAITVMQIVFLGALMLILWRVEKFLNRAMVYMKAKDIHDVLSAESLLAQPKKRKAEDEDAEVVDNLAEDADLENNLRHIQVENRKRFT